MINHIPHPPRRIRIHSHLTKTTFLHVEDSLSIGKLRLFAGSYRNGSAEWLSHHYLDVADARVLFRALAGGQTAYSYQEYKGTPLDDGRAISRVLKVNTKAERVFFELTSGPGTLTATGAVTPSRRADPALPRTQVTVTFEWRHAQRMAEEVLAFLRAWDVARVLDHLLQLSERSPFELAPLPTVHASVEQDTQPPASLDPLRYGDQTQVDEDNPREERAFRDYLQAMGETPPSRAALRQWATA